MDLTAEQYSQVLRYVDGEMDESELKAFRIALAQNKELSAEVAFYTELKSVFESADKKISSAANMEMDKTNSDHHSAFEMIKKARLEWERKDLKGSKENKEIKEVGTPAIQQSSRNTSKSISRWLLAAAFIGLIALSVVWYVQHTKNETGIASNKQNRGSQVVENKKSETASNDIARDTSVKNTLPEDIPKNDTINPQQLFANNFKPDAVPLDKEGPLENAFDYYEKHKYNEAVRAFQNADFGPVTRGLDNSNQVYLFYIHYYKAISYMASNRNILNAISELKKAVSNSPNKVWQTKAQWYLALAYLKNDDTNNAVKWLRQIAGNKASAEYRQKALELIKQLRRRP